MARPWIRLIAVLSTLVVVGACQTYVAQPLDSAEVVASVDRERHSIPMKDPDGHGLNADPAMPRGVRLDEAAAWMLEKGPDVREAVASYRRALARAEVPTAFPNPSLEVGAEFGFGADIERHPLGPFGGLGLSIPLGSRRAEADRLNAARAEGLRIEALARHRELYLELRRSYASLAAYKVLLEGRSDVLAAASRSALSARRLVEAGLATALDVSLFELEKGKARAAELLGQGRIAEAQAELANLVGVHAGFFDQLAPNALPLIPTTLPDLEELKRTLTEQHSALGRLRARYEEAESALRLEIAKQYPDLQIGPSILDDPSDRNTIIGLSLGIELPIFDRNQQAIAEAKEHREEVRTHYEAAANRALGRLETALSTLSMRVDHHRLMRDTILPEAARTIDIARRSLRAGSGDALRLLDAERSYRQLSIEVLQAEFAERNAWIDLEHAVGAPILEFPTQAAGGEKKIPTGLEPAPTNSQPQNLKPGLRRDGRDNS